MELNVFYTENNSKRTFRNEIIMSNLIYTKEWVEKLMAAVSGFTIIQQKRENGNETQLNGKTYIG